MIETACSRCLHPLNVHGAGCTAGWFAMEANCYCPNDYNGEPTVDCEHTHCGNTATHIEPDGCFACPEHAATTAAVLFDAITSWEEVGRA